MGRLGWAEILVIVVLLVILFGHSKIPGMMKKSQWRKTRQQRNLCQRKRQQGLKSVLLKRRNNKGGFITAFCFTRFFCYFFCSCSSCSSMVIVASGRANIRDKPISSPEIIL